MDSDMNATAIAKLPPPVVQSKVDMQAPGAPPSYKELLQSVDIAAPHAQVPQQPSIAPQQQMMMQQQQLYQQPQQQHVMAQQYPAYDQGDDQSEWQPVAPEPRRHGHGHGHGHGSHRNPHHRQYRAEDLRPALKTEPSSRGGLLQRVKDHQTVIIVAIVAFLAMKYAAPKLRSFPAMATATGGLSAIGLITLALLIGSSTKIVEYM